MASLKNNMRVPNNYMVRHHFMEFILRVADLKFMKSGVGITTLQALETLIIHLQKY